MAREHSPRASHNVYRIIAHWRRGPSAHPGLQSRLRFAMGRANMLSIARAALDGAVRTVIVSVELLEARAVR